jgi:hypothetical protein
MRDRKEPHNDNPPKEKEDDWDLGTPQNSCRINKKPDEDCDSCQ